MYKWIVLCHICVCYAYWCLREQWHQKISFCVPLKKAIQVYNDMRLSKCVRYPFNEQTLFQAPISVGFGTEQMLISSVNELPLVIQNSKSILVLKTNQTIDKQNLECTKISSVKAPSLTLHRKKESYREGPAVWTLWVRMLGSAEGLNS